MPESALSELPKPSEMVLGKYDIHFEPGMHADLIPGIAQKSEDVIKKFESGDLTAHAWNPEVAQRMKQYSPLIFGLDSVDPYPASSPDVFWPWLPGSPKEMNGQDSVYLVGGDHSDLEIGDAWGEVVKYAQNTLGIEIPPHIILPIGVSYLLSKMPREKISRRTLLKAGLGLGGLSLADMLAKFAPAAESYSTSSDNPLKKIPQFVRPVLKSNWLDGRTALVIAKTIDSMERLNLPKGTAGSIVFGWPHEYESFKFMGDKIARKDAIKKFAVELNDDAFTKADEDTFNYLYEMVGVKSSDVPKKDILMNSTLITLASTTIYKVKEPESSRLDEVSGKDGNKLIEKVDYFLDPEVMDVASSLGNVDIINKFYQSLL